MIMKIVLISCVKKKLSYRARAQDLYISPLFRFNLEYARSLKPDAIYILSAKYGLVSLDQEIDTYDLTLNTMGENQKKAWAQKVLMDLRQKTSLAHDHFIFLAGMNYRKHLIPSMHSYEIPLEGYSFGEHLRKLKRKINE
jgi:hypothetical protein